MKKLRWWLMLRKRRAIATEILAGFAANPSVFAHNESCGWALVNCTDEQVAGYAVRLADALIEANSIIGLRSIPDGGTSR